MSSWCRYQTNQWQFLDNLKKIKSVLIEQDVPFLCPPVNVQFSCSNFSVFMPCLFCCERCLRAFWVDILLMLCTVQLCIEIWISDRSCYRVTASEWFTMSNGIESADVSINTSRRSTSHRPSLFSRSVFADFWFTHNLLPQEETSIALNKVDSQEAFTACGAPCPRQRGRWGCWSRSWSHCR